MKKLMLAAAVLATGVAVAADCDRPITPVPTPEGGAAVYQLKMPLKTTKGIATLTKGSTTTIGGVCSRGQIVIDDSACVYRTADQINLEGLFAICTNTCDSLEKATIYLWETRRKVPVSAAKVDWKENGFLHIMGKNFTEAEALWSITGGNLFYEATEAGSRAQQIKGITCAGLGKFDLNKGLYTSLSGNAVGRLSAPYDLKLRDSMVTSEAIAKVVCDPSKIWTCANLGSLCEDAKADDTVVYGTWSIKYNASLSKKFYNTGYLPLPSYYDIVL